MKIIVVVFSVVALFVAIAVNFLSITDMQSLSRRDCSVGLTNQPQHQYPVYKRAKRSNSRRETAVENYNAKTVSPALFHKNTVAPADFHLEESGAFHQPKASNAADYSSSFSSSPLIFSGVAPKGASAAPERHGFMAVNSAYNPKIGLPVQLSAGDGVDPDNGNEEDMGSPLAVGSCLWILLFFILFYSAVKQLRLSRF